MKNVEETLTRWQQSLREKLSRQELYARNEVVYKWMALYRCWSIREATFWRVNDLLVQSSQLHKLGHGLGPRILIRSSFETLASLIYLNLKIRDVIDNKLNFHEFGELTLKLSIGSRNQFTKIDAVNVMAMIKFGERKYPGLQHTFDSLSESAHPNFEGLLWGYSKVDHAEYETNFSDRWMDIYGDRNLENLKLCMITFEFEYNKVWPSLIQEFEDWVATHDEILEKTKDN